MKKTSRFLSVFLALAMALALAVPAFADVRYMTLADASCLAYTVAPAGKALIYNDSGSVMMEWAVFDQAVTFTVKGGGSIEEIRGNTLDAEESLPVNGDGSATLPADAKGVYDVQFSWLAWPEDDMYDLGYFMACSKSYVDELLTNGGYDYRIEYVPNGNPAAPAQPSAPAQPAAPSATTATAKPAPGVSVALNDGSGEFAYTIKAGDTLSGIAAYYYGNANVYKLIHQRNKDTIKNANMIYAGQTIILPSYAAVAQGAARI